MIKNMRLSRGWAQEQLADFSGLSVRTVQRLERGHSTGLKSLKCIAAALEMEVATLRSEDGADGELFLGANPILPVRNVLRRRYFMSGRWDLRLRFSGKILPTA